MKNKVISEIRAFNRFYTRIIGLLDQHVLDSKYSLPEVRVLYEIYHHNNLTARDIMATLNIDKGYLSRMLQNFKKAKLVSKKRSGKDGRSAHLSLTDSGKVEFKVLNRASDHQLKEILDGLTSSDCDKLVRYMSGIKEILSRSDQNAARI